MKRLNTKQSKHAARCIKVILWRDTLTDSQRSFLKDQRRRIMRESGYRPSGSEMVLLEGYISHFLSPFQIERLRKHNVGPKAGWVKTFGQEVKAG